MGDTQSQNGETMTKVALLGIPYDASSSFQRGTAGAPVVIREALWSEAGNAWSETGIDLKAGGLEDDGDLWFSEREPGEEARAERRSRERELERAEKAADRAATRLEAALAAAEEAREHADEAASELDSAREAASEARDTVARLEEQLD